MAQINFILNVCVIAALTAAAVFWIETPAPPKPLPNDPHFVAQIQQSGTVLVKFGAKWCPPCRMIEQELDALATTSSSDVSIVKIDIDQNHALASHYQVSSIPCLLLFRNGKQIGKALGYRSREQLKTWVTKTQ